MTIADNNCSVNFLGALNQVHTFFRQNGAQSIDCRIDGCHITLANRDLGNLNDHLENYIKKILIDAGFVYSLSQANYIIEKIERGNDNPDEFSEFKNYVEGFRNLVLSYFESFLHPVSCALSIPNLILNTVIKPFVEDEDYIKKINNLDDFVYSGTLVHKQQIYRCFLRDMLIIFSKFKKFIILDEVAHLKSIQEEFLILNQIKK